MHGFPTQHGPESHHIGLIASSHVHKATAPDNAARTDLLSPAVSSAISSPKSVDNNEEDKDDEDDEDWMPTCPMQRRSVPLSLLPKSATMPILRPMTTFPRRNPTFDNVNHWTLDECHSYLSELFFAEDADVDLNLDSF